MKLTVDEFVQLHNEISDGLSDLAESYNANFTMGRLAYVLSNEFNLTLDQINEVIKWSVENTHAWAKLGKDA